MTENLKIEVSMVDVEGGVVDTSLATKDELAAAVETKADLIQGKVPVIQLPGFNEISGVSEAINGVENKLRDEMATTMANNNNGLESRIDDKLETKADLVNGRVPASQSPAFKDVEGAKGALDGLKEALTAKYDQKVKDLSEGKADLVGGKVPANQLPVDEIVSPLEFQLKSQELDKKFVALENIIDLKNTEFTSSALNLISRKANVIDVYKRVEIDSKLSNKVDLSTLNTEFVKKADQTYVDNALAAFTNGASKFYPTLAAANADIANITNKDKVEISELGNAGVWYKPLPASTALVKSPYDPLTDSKKYTDQSLGSVVEAYALKKADDSDIFNIVNDGLGNSLVWIDKQTGIFHAVGLFYSVFRQIFALKQYTNPNYAPICVDSNGNILAGVNLLTHKFEAVGLSSSNEVKKSNHRYYAKKPLVQDINHVLSYGQSLSVGATATVILSVAQMYYNLTFNTGPRQDSAATSVIPLVEQFNNPSSDGYTNRGETHCSGLANYASRMMQKDYGIEPQKHVIFASTAGHGGYTVDQLKKGSSWYSVLLDHVTKAKSLNVGKAYHVPVIPWAQGENNAVSGGLQTPYDVYKAELAKLQVDADIDIRSITGQVDPVRFITYQMSYAAATWPEVAKAQLDLVRENEHFMLSTPMYHLPYAGDKVHLTNVGYKWMGAYIGRAYTQYMVEGRKSDFINPLAAEINGNRIVVKFDVPTSPLQIDVSSLASTQNAGFKVMNGAVEIPILSVSASDDTVVLELASSPANSVKVRYALDFLGTGLKITGGASGNLRDSTPDTAVIAGVTKPLYHVCPHFELTAFLDKGI